MGKEQQVLFGRKNLIFIILSVQRNLCAGFAAKENNGTRFPRKRLYIIYE